VLPAQMNPLTPPEIFDRKIVQRNFRLTDFPNQSTHALFKRKGDVRGVHAPRPLISGAFTRRAGLRVVQPSVDRHQHLRSVSGHALSTNGETQATHARIAAAN